MFSEKEFEDLGYTELLDLLSSATKQYTAALASDRKWEVEDERIYFINLLIKEIELREKNQIGLAGSGKNYGAANFQRDMDN